MSIRLIRGRAPASVAFSHCQRTRRPNMLRHPKENLSTSEGDKIAQTPLGWDRSLRHRSAGTDRSSAARLTRGLYGRNLLKRRRASARAPALRAFLTRRARVMSLPVVFRQRAGALLPGHTRLSPRPLDPEISPRRRFAGYTSSTVLCHVEILKHQRENTATVRRIQAFATASAIAKPNSPHHPAPGRARAGSSGETLVARSAKSPVPFPLTVGRGRRTRQTTLQCGRQRTGRLRQPDRQVVKFAFGMKQGPRLRTA